MGSPSHGVMFSGGTQGLGMGLGSTSSPRVGRMRPHLLLQGASVMGSKRRSAVLELQSILVSILIRVPSCSPCPLSSLCPSAWVLPLSTPAVCCGPQGAMRRASRRAGARQSSLKGKDQQLEAILQRRRRALDADPEEHSDAEAAEWPDPGSGKGLGGGQWGWMSSAWRESIPRERGQFVGSAV